MINYTLNQIYSFEAVVRLKSFTKAGKELFITQPITRERGSGTRITI